MKAARYVFLLATRYSLLTTHYRTQRSSPDGVVRIETGTLTTVKYPG